MAYNEEDMFPPDMDNQLAAVAPPPDAPSTPPATAPAPPAPPAQEAPAAAPTAPATAQQPVQVASAPADARPPPPEAAPPGQAPQAPGGSAPVVVPDSARLAKVNNNPGNLKFAGQQGAVMGEGGFAKFTSPEAGVEALMKQVVTDGQRGMTLGAFVTKYSPPGENDTIGLIKSYSRDLGVSPDTPLTAHGADGKPIIPLDKLIALVAHTESGTQISLDQVHDAIGTPSYARPGIQVASNDPGFAPGGSPAPAPTSPYDFSKMFQDNKDTLQKQSNRIDDYIKRQPEFDAALQAAREKYKTDTTPSQSDKFNDIFSAYQQGDLAASGLRHATAGGVLLHALPDMSGAQRAAEAGHQIDLQQRASQLARSGAEYTQTQGDIANQQQQGAAALTAQGGLAAEMIKNGIESGKLTIEAANAGLAITQRFEDAAHKAIPNPETYSRLAPIIAAAVKDTPTDYNGNMTKLAKIVSDAQAGGQQISVKEPAAPTNMKPPPGMMDADGRPAVPVTLDTSTPQGKSEFDDLRSKKWTFVPPTPVTNINSGPSGGGIAADTQKTALAGLTAAQDVSHHIAYLQELAKAISTTGVLTDSPMSLQVQNAVKQLTGADPGNISAREFFNKELKAFANSETFSMFKASGTGSRMGQQEFKILGEGIVKPTMPLDTITAALSKYGYDADREVKRQTTLGNNAFNAQQNSLPFNPIQETADFEKNNPYNAPRVPADWLGQGQPATPAGVPVTKTLDGVTYTKDPATGAWHQ